MKRWKLSNWLLLAFFSMFVIAVIFVGYALQHPELSFPIPLETTWAIYKTYIAAMLLLLSGAIIAKIAKK